MVKSHFIWYKHTLYGKILLKEYHLYFDIFWLKHLDDIASFSIPKIIRVIKKREQMYTSYFTNVHNAEFIVSLINPYLSHIHTSLLYLFLA